MKKSVTIALAITFALAFFAGCTRGSINYYLGPFVSRDNISSVSQANNYYLGPSVSVVTGILTTKTIETTNVYVLNTDCPINVSNNNITVNNISMIQLAGCGPNVSPYIGSQVRLTGKFFLGCAANNDTQLMMEVSKFEVYNTVPVSQCNAQGYAQSYAQCNPQSSAQSNAQDYEQGYTQGYTQGYVQGKEQGNTQGNTQINTQINAQGNAQVNAQINTQSNTKNSTQNNVQSKPAPAATKPTPKKTEPASAATKPKPKPPAPANPCPPPKPKPSTYRIQVGAYCNPANANNVVAQLQRQNLCPVKEKYKQYTRVVLRGIPANKVDTTVAAVKKAGFDEVWKQRE